MSVTSRTIAASAVSLVAVIAAGAAEAQGFRDGRGGNQGFRGDRGAPVSRQISVEQGRGRFSPQTQPGRVAQDFRRNSPQQQPRISPQVPFQGISPQQPLRPPSSPQQQPRFSPQQPASIGNSPQLQPRFSPQAPVQAQPRFSPQAPVQAQPRFSPQAPVQAQPRFSPQAPVQQAERPAFSPQASTGRAGSVLPLVAAGAIGGSLIAGSVAASTGRPAALVDRPQVTASPGERAQFAEQVGTGSIPQQPEPETQVQLTPEQQVAVAGAAPTEGAAQVVEPVVTASIAKPRIIGLYRDADGNSQYLREGDTENLASATEIWGDYAPRKPTRVVYRHAPVDYGYRPTYGRVSYRQGNHCYR